MLPYLQFLRGAASLMVMLFHYRGFLDAGAPHDNWGTALFGQGYMGVDVFFVLSGFIIVYSTRNPEHANPLDFLIRRFFRVVPLAWLATLTFYLLEGAVHPAGTLFSSLAFIPLENANPPFYGYSLYAIVWSISYELVFYLVFSFALLFSHKYRTAIAAIVLGFFIYVFQYLLTGSFTLSAQGAALPSFDLRFFPIQLFDLCGNSITLEFVVGMVLAETYLVWTRKNATLRSLYVLLVSAGLLAGFLYYYLTNAGGGHGLLGKGPGAVCLVLACLFAQAAAPPRWLWPAVWLYLGEISYSLYLVHNGIVDRVIGHFRTFGVRFVGHQGWESFLIYCAVATVLAAASHRFLEEPLQAWGKRIVAARSARPRAKFGMKAGVTMAVLGLVILPWSAAQARKIQSENMFSGDGSFEQTISHWTGTITPAAGVRAITRGHSAHIITSKLMHLESPMIKVTPGKSYRIDLRALVLTGAMRVQLLGGEKQVPLAELHTYARPEWENYSEIATIPANCHFAVVSIDDYHTAADFSIDAVTLRPQW